MLITLDTNKKYKIGFAGAPCSGKDHMADMLCAAISNPCEKIAEEARRYMEENGSIYSVFQQHIIYHRQLRREQEIMASYQVGISSCPLFLCYFYAPLLLPKHPTKAEYSVTAELYKESVMSINDYDYIFFCDPLQTYEDDGIRYQSNKDRLLISESIRNFLDLHRANYVILPNVSASERLKIIDRTLKGQIK